MCTSREGLLSKEVLEDYEVLSVGRLFTPTPKFILSFLWLGEKN